MKKYRVKFNCAETKKEFEEVNKLHIPGREAVVFFKPGEIWEFNKLGFKKLTEITEL